MIREGGGRACTALLLCTSKASNVRLNKKQMCCWNTTNVLAGASNEEASGDSGVLHLAGETDPVEACWVPA